jgi:transaldolase
MSQGNPLQQLHGLGQSFWWDALSRRALEDGMVAQLRDQDGMRGITSNPSIFQAAIAGSNDYDAALGRLVAEGVAGDELFWRLAIEDIQVACDILRPVYEESEAADGFVSLEVSPHFAFRPEETLAQVKELWGRVDRPNLMIKIPGTPEGIPAIRQALIDGHNINVTLLFAQEAHVAVMNTYLDALEERRARGLSLDKVASVASFFVSRMDSLVDGKLDEIGSEEARALKGKAGVANTKLAYQNFLEIFTGDRWRSLADAGARVQRPLWASTSTKDPAYPDTLYVDELIGRDTVNTLPTVTVDAFRDHGVPEPDRILSDVEGAERHLNALEGLGISVREATDHLLMDGVNKFEKAFDELLGVLEDKVRRMEPTRGD